MRSSITTAIAYKQVLLTLTGWAMRCDHASCISQICILKTIRMCPCTPDWIFMQSCVTFQVYTLQGSAKQLCSNPRILSRGVSEDIQTPYQSHTASMSRTQRQHLLEGDINTLAFLWSFLLLHLTSSWKKRRLQWRTIVYVRRLLSSF